MNPFSFIHCADLHLDSPFEGLRSVEPIVADFLRKATFAAFDKVVDLALENRVSFLIVAGDVYDGEDRSLRAQLRFREVLRRAAAAGIQCFIAHGNHDPTSGWEAKLEWPDKVHRFRDDGVERVVVEEEGQPLACLYGTSFRRKEVRGNLTSGFRRQGEDPFAIGVLHCNVGGDPNHDNYAPCTISDLAACGMDYWALGHIHARRLLKERDPCIVYPGNLQGRNWRELGARGCYLVKVDERGAIATEFLPTDVVRWFLKSVDIADMPTLDDLLEKLSRTVAEVRAEAHGRAAILRLILTGRGDLHRELLHRVDPERDLAQPLWEEERGRPDFVWLESVKNQTSPPRDIEKLRKEPTFVGDFLKKATAIRGATDPAAALRQALSQPEHRVVALQFDQWSPDDWEGILAAAETLGLDLLLDKK